MRPAPILGFLLCILSFSLWGRECPPIHLYFEPGEQVELTESSWVILENMSGQLRRSSEIVVQVARPIGSFGGGLRDRYSERMGWVERWLQEERVWPGVVTTEFTMMGSAPGPHVIIQLNGCEGNGYRREWVPDVSFHAGDGIQVTCKENVVSRIQSIRVSQWGLPETLMEKGWPANSLEDGRAMRIVGLIQVDIPDTAVGLAFRLKVPLRGTGNIRRAQLMRPGTEGLRPAREKVRMKSEGELSIAMFSPPESGVYAIVESSPVLSQVSGLSLLAPDGWTFEKVRWRSITQFLATPIGDMTHFVVVEPERTTPEFLVDLTFRDAQGNVQSTGWSYWHDLPMKKVLPWTAGKHRQFDPDFFADSTSISPIE